MNRKLFSIGFACLIALFFIPHLAHAQDSRPIVRLIYFLPKDRQPQPDIDAKLDKLIKDTQQLFADQMDAHGFGRKTFQIEVGPTGKTVVHHFVGQFTDAHYSNLANTWDIWEEIDKRFDTSKNIYVTVIDMSSVYLDNSSDIAGQAKSVGSSGGQAHVTVSTTFATAHELGHAFGLRHDQSGNNTKRIWRYTQDPMLNSFCAAEWLDAHRAFNHIHPLEQTEFPQFKMLPPSLVSPPNIIRLRFEITNDNGIHQVQLLTRIRADLRLLSCEYLKGNTSGTVEFVTTDLTPQTRYVSLISIDVHGNYAGYRIFPIDITPLLPRAKTISISDPHLAAAVQREIGNITTHSMLNLWGLDVANNGITNLTGLEYAHNLRQLNLGSEYIEGEGYVNSNTVSNLSPLIGLTELEDLNLTNTILVDWSALSELTNLIFLYLQNTNISDVSPLSELTQLTWLVLDDNKISDVSALSGLTNLISLGLNNNKILDVSALVSALSGLTNLISLGLNNNKISDVSALSGLTNLTSLGLNNNNISDISALSELTQLIGLQLFGNNISDVSPLSELTRLSELGLDSNNISDVSPLQSMTQLEFLLLGNNNISDVSALSEWKQLTELYLHNNNISDVSPLSELTNLTSLDLNHNNILDMSPLVALNLTGTPWDITGLHLWNNPLSYVSINTHIPAMQAKGIEVQYSQRIPTKLLKLSGDAQQAVINAELPLPLVVQVQDQNNREYAEVPVTFSITKGSEKLSITNTTTDAKGRAKARFTLGKTEGETTIRVTAAKISKPMQFTVTAILPTSFVHLPDTNLTAKITETLGKLTEASITVADILTLTSFTANNTSISDLTGLQHASNLITLRLNSNNLYNIDPLTGLTQLKTLSLDNNNLSDIAPLVELTQLETLSLEDNKISDVAPLVELTELKTLRLRGNLLSYPSLYTTIPTMRNHGVDVAVDTRIPTTLINVPGTPGVAGATLQVIVQVQDQKGVAFSGVPVNFTLTTADEHHQTLKAITNINGTATTLFKMGPKPSNNVVTATVIDIPQPLNFTITTIDANTLVPIPDVNLHTKIVESLNKPKNAKLNAGDLLRLTRLDAPNAIIQDLTGIEYAYNLNELNLGAQYIGGKGWTNNNKIIDFTPLEQLPLLSILVLNYSSLSDISTLTGHTQLTYLDLGVTLSRIFRISLG